MTIDEAIEEQALYFQHSDQWSYERLTKAMKLGIEALKRCQENRKYKTIGSAILLPGETE